jgi:hypothetical protein
MDMKEIQLNPEKVINLLREKVNAANWQITVLEAHVGDLEAQRADLLAEVTLLQQQAAEFVKPPLKGKNA